MSEQTQPQETKEIDLLEITSKLFSTIGRGFTALFKGLKNLTGWFFRTIKKHFWILFILAIVGAGGGYFKAKKQRPYYETEMMVETQIISRVQVAERLNFLQELIDDRSNLTLASELKLPAEDVKHIFYIKADIYNVSVEVPLNKRDSAEEELITEELGPQFLRIRIRVWDNKSIKKLEHALVTYIETDPYTQERFQLLQEANMKERENIKEQIDQLLLFQKKNIEKSSSVLTSGNMPFMVQNEERTYVSEILKLKTDIINLERAYELTRPLSVIQPFTPFESPVDRTLFNTVFFAVLFSGCGFIFLVFRQGWKKL
ncbi:MAG: hypothetical protein LBU91_09595 [Bacteroidales bacterium]|jgi:hypothetical protein|nr:hypothetical protein [Bacteroidales bacterium]